MRLFIDCSRLVIGGGIQVGLSVITKALTTPGLDLCIVCSAQIAEQLSQCAGADYHVVGQDISGSLIKQSIQMSALERSWKPDVVFHVFGPSYWKSNAANVQGFALGKMLYPEVRRIYNRPIYKLREEISDLLKRVFFSRNADFYVVETDVVKSRLAKRLGISEDNIWVVGNSYSPAFRDRCQLYSQSPMGARGFSIFIPSSHYLHKNLLIAPKAAYILKKAGQNVRFVYTLNRTSSGWGEISKLASDLGVDDMISTVGAVPNEKIADEYLSMDAVLCPSFVESSTAVFPEAFLAGKPLIASDRDFARQLCGEAAVYFEPREPSSLAQAITAVITNPQLRQICVDAGKKRLRDTYPSPEEKWDMQLEMLSEVMRRGKHRKEI